MPPIFRQPSTSLWDKSTCPTTTTQQQVKPHQALGLKGKAAQCWRKAQHRYRPCHHRQCPDHCCRPAQEARRAATAPLLLAPSTAAVTTAWPCYWCHRITSAAAATAPQAPHPALLQLLPVPPLLLLDSRLLSSDNRSAKLPLPGMNIKADTAGNCLIRYRIPQIPQAPLPPPSTLPLLLPTAAATP